MKNQVTKQPACCEVVEQKRSKECSTQKLKAGVVSILMFVIRFVLKRPATWQWLIVHFPAIVEKAEVILNQVIAWFTDHI